VTYYDIGETIVNILIRERIGVGDGQTYRDDKQLPKWVRVAKPGLYDENGKIVEGAIK